MKERPILMSAPMVRAILEGNKTETRRIVKPGTVVPIPPGLIYGTLASGEEMECPRFVSKYAPIIYAADGNPPNTPNRHYSEGLKGGKISAPDPYAIWSKRPSIFMPRWASRILLEITNIRVERLQDISDEDAKAEGVLITDEWTDFAEDLDGSYIKAYRCLWESINGAGSWDINPFVWVYEFKRLEL